MRAIKKLFRIKKGTAAQKEAADMVKPTKRDMSIMRQMREAGLSEAEIEKMMGRKVKK